MASLETHYGSYRIVFRFDGRKYSRSLGTDNPRIAKAALARLEDNLTRVELGQLILPQPVDLATFLLSDGRLDQRQAVSEDQDRTLGELLDAYLSQLTPDAYESTTERCLRIHIAHLKRVLGEETPLRSVDLAGVQRYVDYRATAKGRYGKKLSPDTIKKEVATLNLVWNWGQLHQLVDRPLPKKGLRYSKTEDKPPFQTVEEIRQKIVLGGLSEKETLGIWEGAFLTRSDVDELLQDVQANARHGFLYPMFVFAAHTGARRSEMRRSLKEDLDFGRKMIIIRERKRVRGRHTLRSVPMSPLLEQVLQEWLAAHPGGRHTFCLGAAVEFSTKDRREPIPLTDDELAHHFKRVLLGTKWEMLRGWHVFRHSFCSNCAAAGIDQRMIDAWVGHQTEAMRRRYRHLLPTQQHAAIASVFG